MPQFAGPIKSKRPVLYWKKQLLQVQARIPRLLSLEVWCPNPPSRPNYFISWGSGSFYIKNPHKVPHRRLLHKLEYDGIRGSTYKWIYSWLSGCTQQVVLDGETRVVSAKCLTSLNGHLLRPGGTSPPCFSFTR